MPHELSIQDWGVTYEELEPFYDRFEYLAGISAIVLVIVVLGILAWVLLHSSHIAVTVNGHKLVGPVKLAAEGWGLLVAIGVALLRGDAASLRVRRNGASGPRCVGDCRLRGGLARLPIPAATVNSASPCLDLRRSCTWRTEIR